MPIKKTKIKRKATSYKTKYVQMSALALAILKKTIHTNAVMRVFGMPTADVVGIVKLMEKIHKGEFK